MHDLKADKQSPVDSLSTLKQCALNLLIYQESASLAWRVIVTERIDWDKFG